MELTLSAEQKHIITAKQIQSAAVLQMTAADLKLYLEQQALENPILESPEPEESTAPINQNEAKQAEKYEWLCEHDEQNSSIYSGLPQKEKDLPGWNIASSTDTSLAAYLWDQLLPGQFSALEQKALRFLLASLDARGYYKDSLTNFATRFQLSAQQAKRLLTIIQSLEPAGVGAQNLSECLCLQADRLGQLTPELGSMINRYLPQVAKNQTAVLAKALKLPTAQVQIYCAQIRKLNPKPGSSFAQETMGNYIIPDFSIILRKTYFQVVLNDCLYPELALNNYYLKMYRQQTDAGLHAYLKEKIRQAFWLRHCLALRKNTLANVAQAIVAYQQDFFLQGPTALKPLRIADIAKLLSINISTVSRACQQKYLECSWGCFALKYFFPKQVGCQDNKLPKTSLAKTKSSAADTTVQNVKKILLELIKKEDPAKPFSDRILSELLKAKGLAISRRTVTKYREQLHITNISGRKKY